MKSPAVVSGARLALSGCLLALPHGQKYLTVRLLTGEALYFIVEVKSRLRDVYDQVVNHLGLNDTELFGLALKRESEYQFMEHSTKLYKCACKAWKGQHGSGLDENGIPLLVFHLRVQLYVDCHLLISDKVSRQHYYLQLKENVLGYFLPLSEERAFLLAANALQADLGNFQADRHVGNYFDPQHYFPFWVVKRYGEAYIRQHVPAMHRENSGQSRGEAQVGYIKEASEATAPHNLHLYKMRRKKAKTHDTVWLGVSAKSLEVLEENGSLPKSHLSRFAWPDIAKLTFEKKKFEIRCVGAPDSRKFVYYSSNEDIAKGLFWLCRLTHQFSMAIQHKEQELKRMELEGRKSFRESYIYSDTSELNWDQGRTELLSGFLKKDSQDANHRISVISNASSNTTSGIVSDKVQSFCESEDELDMEMIISTSSNGRQQNNSESQETNNNRGKHEPRSASGDLDSLVRSGVLQSGDRRRAEDSQASPSSSGGGSSRRSKISSVHSDLSSSDPTAWTYIRAADPLPEQEMTRPEVVRRRSPDSGHSFSSTGSGTVPNPAVVHKPQERTRIGVSSLTRVQKLPLTLFGQAGSEPSLNLMPMWPGPALSHYYYQECPGVSSTGPPAVHRHSLATASPEGEVEMRGFKSTGSIPQDLSRLSSSSQLDCIPPPPAYRTNSAGRPQQLSQVHSISLQTLQERKTCPRQPQAESQSVLDLHQLRQKSLDLDLPLMAALCNDRTLLALPKTVPTCSRQRHVKDVRRFSYSQVPGTNHCHHCVLHGEWPSDACHSRCCPPDPPTVLTSFLKRDFLDQAMEQPKKQILPAKLSLAGEVVHAT